MLCTVYHAYIFCVFDIISELKNIYFNSLLKDVFASVIDVVNSIILLLIYQ